MGYEIRVQGREFKLQGFRVQDLLHAIKFGNLRGANLVTLPSRIEGSETCVVRRVVGYQVQGIDLGFQGSGCSAAIKIESSGPGLWAQGPGF